MLDDEQVLAAIMALAWIERPHLRRALLALPKAIILSLRRLRDNGALDCCEAIFARKARWLSLRPRQEAMATIGFHYPRPANG